MFKTKITSNTEHRETAKPYYKSTTLQISSKKTIQANNAGIRWFLLSISKLNPSFLKRFETVPVSMRTEASKYRSSRYVEYILFSPSCGLTVIGFIHDRKDITYPQGHVQTNVDKSTFGKFLVLENAG